MKKLALIFIFFIGTCLGQWVATDPIAIAPPVSSNPLVQVDKNDDSLALWTSSPNTVMGSRLSPNSTTWNNTDIVTIEIQFIAQKALAMDRKCVALALWDVGGALPFLEAARLKPGQSQWTKTAPIPLPFSLITDSLNLGVDADGNAIALWIEQTLLGATVVKSSRLPANSNFWTPPILVTPIPGTYSQAHLAVNLKGKAVAVWLLDNGLNTIVQGACLGPNGVLWELTDFASPPLTDNDTPKVALDNFGNATTVYVSDDGMGAVIRGATLKIGSTNWELTDIASTSTPNSEPQVIRDVCGNSIAIWVNGDTAQVDSAVLPCNTSNWEDRMQISTTATDPLFPRLVTDDFGNNLAIWAAAPFFGTIQGAKKPFNKDWEETNDAGGAVSFQALELAISPNGTKATAVWQDAGLIPNTDSVFGATASKIFPPVAPAQISGKQIKNFFPAQQELFNRIFWAKSPSAVIVFYKVFKDDVLVKIVEANKNFIFEDHNINEDATHTYKVTAVNRDGDESLPISITLP